MCITLTPKFCSFLRKKHLLELQTAWELLAVSFTPSVFAVFLIGEKLNHKATISSTTVILGERFWRSPGMMETFPTK